MPPVTVTATEEDPPGQSGSIQMLAALMPPLGSSPSASFTAPMTGLPPSVGAEVE